MMNREFSSEFGFSHSATSTTPVLLFTDAFSRGFIPPFTILDVAIPSFPVRIVFTKVVFRAPFAPTVEITERFVAVFCDCAFAFDRSAAVVAWVNHRPATPTGIGFTDEICRLPFCSTFLVAEMSFVPIRDSEFFEYWTTAPRTGDLYRSAVPAGIVRTLHIAGVPFAPTIRRAKQVLAPFEIVWTAANHRTTVRTFDFDTSDTLAVNLLMMDIPSVSVLEYLTTRRANVIVLGFVFCHALGSIKSAVGVQPGRFLIRQSRALVRTNYGVSVHESYDFS